MFNLNKNMKKVFLISLLALGLMASFAIAHAADPILMDPVGPKMYFGSGYNSSKPVYFEPQYVYPNASRVQIAYDDPEDNWSYKFFEISGFGSTIKTTNYWLYVENLSVNTSYSWTVKACAYRGNGNCNSNCDSTDGAQSNCKWTGSSSPGHVVLTPPAIPYNLSEQNIAQTSVNLYWSGTAGSSVYGVKVWKGNIATRTNSLCGADTAPWPVVYLPSVNSGTAITGLEPNTTYTWSVHSGHNNNYFSSSNSQWVNPVSWNCLLRPENTHTFTTGGAPQTKYSCSSSYQCVTDQYGQYTSLSSCQSNCQAPPVRYSCSSSYQCIQNTSGPYASISACQTDCVAPTKYSCSSSYQCVTDQYGQYTSLSSCQSNCQAPPVRYSCSSSYQCIQNVNGPYISLSACQNDCVAPTKYACNSSYQCIQNTSGPYTSLSACQNDCVAPTKYSCNQSTYRCYSDPLGQYSTLSQCQANCIETPTRYSCDYLYRCAINVSGPYTSIRNCQDNCIPPTKYSCNQSTYRCYSDPLGQYGTLSQCQADCYETPNRYSCNQSTYRCYSNINGQYASLSVCQDNCVQQNRYTCNQNTWRCYADQYGSYTSLSLCQTNCVEIIHNRYDCNTSTRRCYANNYGAYYSLSDCENNCLEVTRTPSVRIVANPTTINSGQSSYLSWSSSNVTYCTASEGWSGSKSTYGQEYVSPTQTTNYKISCYGNYGTAVDWVTVNVVSTYQNNTLTLEKWGRNVSNGENNYSKSIIAGKGDVIEFYIRLANNSAQTINNVVVSDALPAGLSYYSGTTKLDGLPQADGLTTSGLNLGNLSSNAVRIIIFQSIVQNPGVYYSLTNVARAQGSNASNVTAECTVIYRGGSSTTVNTGPTNSLWIAIAASLAATAGLWYFLSFHRKGQAFLKGLEERFAENRLKRIQRISRK